MTEEQWTAFDAKSIADKVIVKKVKEEFFLIKEGPAEEKMGGPFKSAEDAALNFITPVVVLEKVLA